METQATVIQWAKQALMRMIHTNTRTKASFKFTQVTFFSFHGVWMLNQKQSWVYQQKEEVYFPNEVLIQD